IPSDAPRTPRKMLPPPTTMQTSTPRATAVFTSCAVRLTVAGSIPYSPSPIKASPEIFRRTRLNLGFDICSFPLRRARQRCFCHCLRQALYFPHAAGIIPHGNGVDEPLLVRVHAGIDGIFPRLGELDAHQRLVLPVDHD